MKPLLFPALFAVFICFSGIGNAKASNTPEGKTLQTSPSPVKLAANGKALVSITIGPDSSAVTRNTAAEMAAILRQMTGAEFAIVESFKPAGITLGTLDQYPDADLDKPLAIRNLHDGKEAYSISSRGGLVCIIGATDIAVSDAAYRFLELMGCRWFFPSAEWTIIPKTPVLEFALNEVSRPKVLSRDIWYTYGVPWEPGVEKKDQRSLKEIYAWNRHNRMQKSFFQVHSQGSWAAYSNDYKAEFEANPELRPLNVKGERIKWAVCSSQPRVREMFKESIRRRLAEKPEKEIISVEPPDGANWHCYCDLCKAKGSVSNAVFDLANDVAKMVAKEFPGKMVHMLGYYGHSTPPTFPLEPNILLQLCTQYDAYDTSLEQQYGLWQNIATLRGIYDYPATCIWGQDRLRAPLNTGPAGHLRSIQKRLKRLCEAYPLVYEAESTLTFGQYGLGYYLTTKLTWDLDADPESLIEDFYRQAFGPAYAPMKRFYNRLDADSGRLITPDFLRASYADLKEAASLAASREDVLKRVDDLKLFLHVAKLWMMVYESPWNRLSDEEKKKAIFDGLQVAYRMRYTYMIHSKFLESCAPPLAKKYNEPSWVGGKGVKASWAENETPYTRDEINAFMEADLAALPADPQKVSYSSHLVPVSSPETYPELSKAETSAYQIFGLNWGVDVASPQGQPITFDLNIKLNNRLLGWKLKDASGKVIRDEPLDLKKMEYRDKNTWAYRAHYECPVPSKGIYRIEIVSEPEVQISQSAGEQFLVELPKNTPSAVAVNSAQLSTVAGPGSCFIYVPKGTREVQLFTMMPLTLWAPGQNAPVVDKDQAGFLSIPVPEGAAGRFWSLRTGLSSYVQFFNVPPYITKNPNAALLPKETAERDQLITQ